jgi:hypothetical protein
MTAFVHASRERQANVTGRADLSDLPEVAGQAVRADHLELQRLAGNRAVSKLFAQGNPPTRQELVALQGSAGNRVVADLLARNRVLQRVTGEAESWSIPRVGDPVRVDNSRSFRGYLGHAAEAMIPMLPNLTEYFAAHHYTNPLHRELVAHYVHGRGRPFHLTREQMTQVLHPGSWGQLDLLGDAQNYPQIAAAKDTIRTRLEVTPTATIWVNERAGLVCDDDLPSLGGFTAWVDGAVTGSRGSAAVGRDPETPFFTFEGTMHWHDWWDFDRHVPDPNGRLQQRRTPAGEAGTRLGADFLPGQPFSVDTVTVPVRHDDDQRAARRGATF